MFRMRRASGITLVLMGGGVAAGLATCAGADAECREARKYGLPEAARLCSSGSGSGGSGRSGLSSAGFYGSDRGGFGSTATAHASAGG